MPLALLTRINETPSILQLQDKQRTLGGLLGDRRSSVKRDPFISASYSGQTLLKTGGDCGAQINATRTILQLPTERDALIS